MYLFEKINIFEILKEHIIPKDTLSNKFTFTSNNTITHGYIPFIISLCYKINCVIGGIPIKLSIEESSKFISEQKFNEKTSDRYDDSINESQELILYQKNICESLRKYNNEEWNEFFKNYICETVKLYDNKLLFEDNETDVNLFIKIKELIVGMKVKMILLLIMKLILVILTLLMKLKVLKKKKI